jgi:membrane-associated protein
MIELLAIHLKDLLNPEFYIQHGGLWLFLFIVFAETGLFAGFFLPGDSLLFVAGIYCNELAAEFINLQYDIFNLLLIASLVVAAGILVWCCKRTISFQQKRYLFLQTKTPQYSKGIL